MDSAWTTSAPEDMAIGPAGASAFGGVIGILDETARWLNAKVIRQWLSPPPEIFCELIERELEAGHVFLVRQREGGEASGTSRLTWSETESWNDASEAAYVYSMALRPKMMGQGLGAAILEWV